MVSRKELYKMAGVQQHSQFQSFINEIVFDRNKRNDFYKKIINADPQCIEDDIFRNYFEEYAAERKSNQQDFTPVGIAKLVSELADTTNYGCTAYDPCAGTGTLLIQKWKEEKDKYLPWNYYPHKYLYVAQELSDNAIPYLIHNMAIRGINAVIIHGDTLQRSANQVYFVQNAKDDSMGFSSVNVMPHTQEVLDFFDLNQWTQEPVNHIEDELTDVCWKQAPDEIPVEYKLIKELKNVRETSRENDSSCQIERSSNSGESQEQQSLF